MTKQQPKGKQELISNVVELTKLQGSPMHKESRIESCNLLGALNFASHNFLSAMHSKLNVLFTFVIRT